MPTNFYGTIVSVKAILTELDRDDLAEQIDDMWCWEEASDWAKKNVPRELLDEFAKRVIETRYAHWLYMHQEYMGHNDAVLAALIATGNANYLYLHQLGWGHRDDVLAALIATKNKEYLYRHQRDCGYRDDVAEAMERIERSRSNGN